MAKGSAGRAGAKAAEALRSGGKKPAKVVNENRRYADRREPFTGRPAGRGYADINNTIDPNDTSPIEIEGEGGRRALIYRALPTGKGPVGYVVKMIEPDGRVSMRKTDTFAPAQELALKYGAAEDATGAPEAPRQRRPEEPEAAAPDEAPEMYAEGVISHSGNGMKAELAPVLDRNGRIFAWDVTMFDVNGRRRVERAPDIDAADEIAESHLGRSIRSEAGSRGVAPLGRDELAVHGPYEKPREGSAAQRIIDRLNQARWSSVTDQGPKRGLTTAGDAPTLEYVRSILSDKGNPEAASIVREWISNKKNSDWTKRFDDSDLRPGETRADVIREIKEGAKRGRDYGEEGMTNLARTPASNVAFTEQPSLTRGGTVTADEVAEMARRSGNPTPGARQSRPPFTRDSHDSRDPSLDRAESAVPRSIMDKILPTAPGSKRVQISGMEERISELVKSGELTTDGAKAARAHAEEIVRMLKADKGSNTPIKAKGVTGVGVGNVGGTKQSKFDRTVNRAVGVAPHERINVAGGDPADFDEMLSSTESRAMRTSDGEFYPYDEELFDPELGDKRVHFKGIKGFFAKKKSAIAAAVQRKEMTLKQGEQEFLRIDREQQQAESRARQLADRDVTTARTVGLKEFDGNEYTRGNSTKTKLNALDRLLGESKGAGPVYLPDSYTSPREAALDLLQTVRPEGWEIDGLEKAIADRFRDAKWAEPGRAVRGKGAGPFEPPVRKTKEAAPEVEGEAPPPPAAASDTDIATLDRQIYTLDRLIASQDEPTEHMLKTLADLQQRRKALAGTESAPMTNPLPEGGSPVGVADEALTEVEDMAKGSAGRAGAKGAEALKTAGAKGGKPPRGRKPATSVPDDPRNFSPDEDAPLPPSQRRKAGVDPNFESEAGMLDGDPVDVRAPMTNPLPEGGSPVGLADDAANGPARGRGRRKPEADSPADIFPDEAGDFTDDDIAAQAAAMAHGHEPLPGAPLPAAPNRRQRKQIQQGIDADKQARGSAAAAETWDTLGRAAEDAAIANQRPLMPKPWEWAEMRRLQAEAKQFGPAKPQPWELAEARRLQAEADRARDAGFANESWDSLGNAAERAAIDGQQPAMPRPWEFAESRRLAAEAAEDAARRAEDPDFYDALDGADEFDPNSPVTDPSPRPEAPSHFPRRDAAWEDMTGDSLEEGSGVDRRRVRLSVGDVYGPTPPPAPAKTTAAENIRLLLERFKRGEPGTPPPDAGTPQPELPPELPPPPPDAGTPPPDLTGGRSRWPNMGQSADETEELRRAAGETSTPNNGPAPRVETQARPQEPLPKDSPGMIRRLAGGALKYGVYGGLGAGALHLAGQLGGNSYQPPFPVAPPGGAGGQGGQGGRPGMPMGLSPEDAMILEAELERAGRSRNNGFQTSFHFGR